MYTVYMPNINLHISTAIVPYLAIYGMRCLKHKQFRLQDFWEFKFSILYYIMTFQMTITRIVVSNKATVFVVTSLIIYCIRTVYCLLYCLLLRLICIQCFIMNNYKAIGLYHNRFRTNNHQQFKTYQII